MIEPRDIAAFDACLLRVLVSIQARASLHHLDNKREAEHHRRALGVKLGWIGRNLRITRSTA